MYLPVAEWPWTLSAWTGRPQGLTIDPIGVECCEPAPEPRRGWFGRRRRTPAPARCLHVLTHRELPDERIRSWAVGQLARLLVLRSEPDAAGAALNELAEAEADGLREREWLGTRVSVDGEGCPASVLSVDDGLWAALVEVGADRVIVIGRGLALAEASLRGADAAERRAVYAAALAV